MRTEATRLAEIAQRNRLSYLAFLAEVLSPGVHAGPSGDVSGGQRGQARLPGIKRLGDFDLSATPTVNPVMIATLARGAYLDAGQPGCLVSRRLRPARSTATFVASTWPQRAGGVR